MFVFICKDVYISQIQLFQSSVDLDTRGITLQDVITRAQVQSKRPPQRNVISPLLLEKPKKKIKVKKEISSPQVPSTILADLPVIPKTEIASDTESSSSSSSSSTESDSEETDIKKEIPAVPQAVKKG